MKLELTQNQKKLIQKTVSLEGKRGFKSSASLIAGLILVTGNKGLSFDDIQDTLELSKGAVSLGLSLLTGIGRLEDFKKFNERKRYFRIPLNSSLKEHIEDALEMFVDFKNLVSELIADKQIEFEKDFGKIMDEDLEFVSFILKRVTNAVEEWKGMKKNEKN